jgi:hypothetical protein
MQNLVNAYNIHQTKSDPTHFTETSCSIIDLFLVKNITHVLTSFVADPFIPDLVRFHCPIVIVLKHQKKNKKTNTLIF